MTKKSKEIAREIMLASQSIKTPAEKLKESDPVPVETGSLNSPLHIPKVLYGMNKRTILEWDLIEYTIDSSGQIDIENSRIIYSDIPKLIRIKLDRLLYLAD